MGSKMEVPVYVETNLGTHITIAVSPHITTIDFKRELERAHLYSFPGLGKVTSITVLVKQKSYFYCLPDMLPLKVAFLGCTNKWFVRVHACLSKNRNKSHLHESVVPRIKASHSLVSDLYDHTEGNKNFSTIKHRKTKLSGVLCLKTALRWLVAATYAKRKRKKRKRRHILKKLPIGENIGLEPGTLVVHGQISDAAKGEGNDQKEVLVPIQVWGSNDTVESPRESLSEPVSVSGLIDRYFSNLVEFNQIDCWSSEVSRKSGQNQLKEQEGDIENTSTSVLITKKPCPTCKTAQRMLPSPLLEGSCSVGLRNKYEIPEVGKRLVMASNSFQRCQSSQKFLGSNSNSCKWKRFLKTDAGSITRGLVFEIDDDEE